MQTITHTFTATNETEVTLVFKNTMFNYVQFLELSKLFADDDLADAGIRSDFCWLVSHVDQVDGIDWSPIGRGASLEEFEACYHDFLKLVDTEPFYECVRAVNAMKTRNDPVEKPESALTEAEAADPN